MPWRSWFDTGAQVMIRHPNYTGMQMDQVSRQYTPMKIVQEMDVKRDGARIFKLEGGISISENPNFRFTFAPPRQQALPRSPERLDD